MRTVGATYFASHKYMERSDQIPWYVLMTLLQLRKCTASFTPQLDFTRGASCTIVYECHSFSLEEVVQTLRSRDIPLVSTRVCVSVSVCCHPIGSGPQSEPVDMCRRISWGHTRGRLSQELLFLFLHSTFLLGCLLYLQSREGLRGRLMPR